MGGSILLIRTICLVAFVLWIAAWVLLPTDLYKEHWTMSVKSQLNSITFFREQGTNLIFLTFPIMFIAALGCVYLSLPKIPKKDPYSKSVVKSPFLNSFSSSRVVVTAPFGIVTALEHTFIVMFFALLIWSMYNYLSVTFEKLHMNGRGEKVWQARFRSVAFGFGHVANTCWAFLFFPVTRASSILPLAGLTSESSIKYHIWLGHLSNFLSVGHTIGFLIYWGMTHQMSKLVEWSKTHVSNLAGVIAIVISLVMWAASIRRIRRQMFEVFFYTHHLYILYIIFYVLHVGPAYFCMILPGIFLFVVDRYLRFLQSRKRNRLLAARLLPCGAVELSFSKAPGLYYNPTSILFLNVPSISKLQWHPFTVLSNANLEQDKLSIMVKSDGSWTESLCDDIWWSVESDHLEVTVEGPYGPSSSHFLRHELLVMVCGGSGITPFISIIREIFFQSTKPDCQIPNVHLICSFKNSAELSMLDLLIPISSAHIEFSKIKLQIDAYVTREKEPPRTDIKKPLKCIWYKPCPLDSPVSAVLGPNNWLWLGAIITSSFLMYILLLGMVTRYYIYPIEHNNQLYLWSYKCLWDMFLVCVCVFMVSSAVFLWRKKRNAIKSNQVYNLEEPIPSPTAQFDSRVCNADKDLESLPHDSLVQATKVHFGTRPDLKRLLFDLKASDVGVLVCGPRKMRHEVAKICSSGLADNLYFESISFNW